MFASSFHSLDEIATILAISKPTAFFMRHKICDLLGQINNATPLTGVVEADEMYEPISCKGHSNPDRIPRLHGRKRLPGKQFDESSIKAGLGSDKVCIVTAIDTDKSLFMKMTKLAKVDEQTLSDNLGSIIMEDSIYCTDGDPAHALFAANQGLRHEIITAES